MVMTTAGREHELPSAKLVKQRARIGERHVLIAHAKEDHDGNRNGARLGGRIEAMPREQAHRCERIQASTRLRN